MILLDEPTSNLDSLNEGIILKSLKESAEEETIVLVSHRVSTMNVADVVYEMENGTGFPDFTALDREKTMCYTNSR